MIKNILFDIDDTLLDFQKAEKTALSQTLLHMGVTPAPAMVQRYAEINASQWKLLEKGVLTLPQVKLKRFQMLFGEIGFPGSAQYATGYFENLLCAGVDLMEGAKETLAALSPARRLFAVTNGSAAVQRKRLSGSKIESLFESVFISAEIGFDKPDLRFFENVFEKIPEFQKKETLIVGDSLTSDIKGGQNAGISTVWYNPRGAKNNTEINPDFEIARLFDLTELLKRGFLNG